MRLAPFNQEVARRLNLLDAAKASGSVVTMAFASAMAGQPDRVNITAKATGSAALTFAFAIDVSNRVADICELFGDTENAEAIRAETAKASG